MAKVKLLEASKFIMIDLGDIRFPIAIQHEPKMIDNVTDWTDIFGSFSLTCIGLAHQLTQGGLVDICYLETRSGARRL